MFRRRKRKIQNDTAFLLAGAAVGGVLALLYAPKTGTELRGDIKNEVDNALIQVKQSSINMRNSAVRTADSLVNRAGNILNISRQLFGSSYGSTASTILNEITSIRRAFNSAVETYRNYREQPVPHLRQPRISDVFTSTDVLLNDEDLPKFEGMGRRQE